MRKPRQPRKPRAKKEKFSWDKQIERAEKELLYNSRMIEASYKGTASGRGSEYKIKSKRNNGVVS
jgi:hypothetical protein